MKKARESFNLRIRLIGGAILAIALILTLFSMPDLLTGAAHMSMAGVLLIASANLPSKSLIELKELRGEQFTEMDNMLKKCETEKRALSVDELKDRDNYMVAIRALDKEIDTKEELEKINKRFAGNQGKNELSKEQRQLATYSFVKAIRGFINKNLDGLEAEMHQEAKREVESAGGVLAGIGIPSIVLQRDMTATGTTTVTGDQGGLTIQNTKQGFIDSLKSKLVFKDLGATFLTGLTQGNLSIPKLTANSTPDWVATENVGAGSSQPLFGSVDLSPKRLTTYLNISNQLIRQSSLDVEGILVDNIQQLLQLKLEYAAINGAGTGGVPKGILNTVGIGAVLGGTNGLAPTYQNLIDLESALANLNVILDANNCGYLVNTKTRGKLKSTLKVAGYPSFLWDGTDYPMNGYKAGVTNNVPSNLTKGTSAGVCSSIIYGLWSELIIAQWGGLDMVIDPYTLATSNEIKLTIHSFWDIAVKHPESFAAMLDALTV